MPVTVHKFKSVHNLDFNPLHIFVKQECWFGKIYINLSLFIPCMAPLILSHGTRWWWVVNFMPQQLYPWYLLEAGWAPQASWTFCRTKKSPASARNRTPRPSTGNLRNMFKKDSKNVCIWNSVISADYLSPMPWISQLQALQKTSTLNYIIVKNILIIRDNLVKTGRKLKAYYFY